MVVSMVWVQSWSIVLISLSVLIIAILLLLCCVCWERKDNGTHQLYILDENGMKIVNNSCETEGSFFGRFSPTSKLTPFKKCGNLIEKYRIHSEDEAVNELVDSFDIEKQFDNATLKLEFGDAYQLGKEFDKTFSQNVLEQNINETFTLGRNDNTDPEDTVSSATESSRTTYYSVYPSYLRTNSVPETMRSALSYCDINSLE